MGYGAILVPDVELCDTGIRFLALYAASESLRKAKEAIKALEAATEAMAQVDKEAMATEAAKEAMEAMDKATTEAMDDMRLKIKNLLRMSHYHRIDELILGAWG